MLSGEIWKEMESSWISFKFQELQNSVKNHRWLAGYRDNENSAVHMESQETDRERKNSIKYAVAGLFVLKE